MAQAPEVEMPARVAALDRDPRGFPIFFSIQNASGGYNFKGIDGDQVARCAKEGLCGICGQPLAYWIVFVGGPLSVRSRWFTDPPMHRECVEYAFQVCPFLLRGGWDRSNAAHFTEEFRRADPTASPAKPERMAIYTTRRYEWKRQTDRQGKPFGVELFHAAPHRGIEWREATHERGVRVPTGGDGASDSAPGEESPAPDRGDDDGDGPDLSGVAGGADRELPD